MRTVYSCAGGSSGGCSLYVLVVYALNFFDNGTMTLLIKAKGWAPDSLSPVSSDYEGKSPFAFHETIESVRFDVKPEGSMRTRKNAQ